MSDINKGRWLEEQVVILNAFVASDVKPSRSQRLFLATVLKSSVRRVQIWLQNCRAKELREFKQLNGNDAVLTAKVPSPLHNNVTLQQLIPYCDRKQVDRLTQTFQRAYDMDDKMLTHLGDAMKSCLVNAMQLLSSNDLEAAFKGFLEATLAFTLIKFKARVNRQLFSMTVTCMLEVLKQWAYLVSSSKGSVDAKILCHASQMMSFFSVYIKSRDLGQLCTSARATLFAACLRYNDGHGNEVCSVSGGCALHDTLPRFVSEQETHEAANVALRRTPLDQLDETIAALMPSAQAVEPRAAAAAAALSSKQKRAERKPRKRLCRVSVSSTDTSYDSYDSESTQEMRRSSAPDVGPLLRARSATTLSSRRRREQQLMHNQLRCNSMSAVRDSTGSDMMDDEDLHKQSLMRRSNFLNGTAGGGFASLSFSNFELYTPRSMRKPHFTDTTTTTATSDNSLATTSYESSDHNTSPRSTPHHNNNETSLFHDEQEPQQQQQQHHHHHQEPQQEQGEEQQHADARQQHLSPTLLRAMADEPSLANSRYQLTRQRSGESLSTGYPTSNDGSTDVADEALHDDSMKSSLDDSPPLSFGDALAQQLANIRVSPLCTGDDDHDEYETRPHNALKRVSLNPSEAFPETVPNP